MMIRFFVYFMFFKLCLSNAVASDTPDAFITQSVPFYPNLTIQLLPNQLAAVQDIYRILEKNPSYNFKRYAGSSAESSRLWVDYAVGCSTIAPKNCSVKIWWRLLRKDNAPIAGWVADYPITISEPHAKNHFKNFMPPHTILQQATTDFINALNGL